ncbi:MAG: sugar phosphate isomerase/epimerase [Fimbriimonadaceae bacterium]|nr:sugar phosphate isomerase/epimerase [Fimbriimonadaceae bacterium]
MKIAFMTFACPEWELSEVLGTACELGYDGLEPRLDSQHRHGIEVDLSSAGRAAVKRQAADSDIALCCLATSLQYIKVTPGDRAKLLDDTKARLALAHDLGVPGLRVFAGGLPQGTSLDDGLAAAAENLRSAGELAQQAGVELWLETHDTVCQAVHAAQIVEACAHPAVNFNYDVMHPYRLGEDLDTTFAALGDRIRHCHWHDAPCAEGQPFICRFGEGALPLVEMLRRLQAKGFSGYLSGEWFNDQLGATPGDSLAHYLTATLELLAAAEVA